jgi:hypothetical protein
VYGDEVVVYSVSADVMENLRGKLLKLRVDANKYKSWRRMATLYKKNDQALYCVTLSEGVWSTLQQSAIRRNSPCTQQPSKPFTHII